jgi:hypothetical protein
VSQLYGDFMSQGTDHMDSGVSLSVSNILDNVAALDVLLRKQMSGSLDSHLIASIGSAHHTAT